ncbi:MAG: DUF2937 family protein [Maritimibacter sp.]
MRILALAGGIAGAVTLSQFPEFSQQYVQRLSGAVDELRAVTLAFDTSARVAGLTRDEALDEMSGTSFGASFSEDLGQQVYRYDRLNADYQALARAAPLERLARFYRRRLYHRRDRLWRWLGADCRADRAAVWTPPSPLPLLCALRRAGRPPDRIWLTRLGLCACL